MTDAAQVELIKQLPLILTALGSLILGVLGLLVQLFNRKEILEVKHATNSLLDRRVEAAKDQGRIEERTDAAVRKEAGEVTAPGPTVDPAVVSTLGVPTVTAPVIVVPPVKNKGR